MKEYGEMFLGGSESIPKQNFRISEIDHDPEKGENLTSEQLKTIYESDDESLAHIFAFYGVSRRSLYEGKNIILILNPEQEAKFG